MNYFSTLRVPGSQGEGIAILVNANAKRGGRRVAVQLARALPGAGVRLTRHVDEIDTWVRGMKDRSDNGTTGGKLRAVLAAGGDGSAVALLNALRRVFGDAIPTVGTLPLGTGNAWAHALGAQKLGTCVSALARTPGPLPTRKYTLLQCDGMVTFFAGTGWDAQVLDDYRAQLAETKGPLKKLNKSVYGYLSAMVTRTAPKAMLFGSARVTIESLGSRAYRLTDSGAVEAIVGLTAGTVLYEGPAGVAGCATCPEYGFRFRAYPHAERFPGLMNVRVCELKPTEALKGLHRIWAGEHPYAGIHDWFADHIRMTFSRPVPLQIGGEAMGLRQTVEYKVLPQQVDAVDWRGLYRDVPEPLYPAQR
jgi:diacylglycerol kinase family enzyme